MVLVEIVQKDYNVYKKKSRFNFFYTPKYVSLAIQENTEKEFILA